MWLATFLAASVLAEAFETIVVEPLSQIDNETDERLAGGRQCAASLGNPCPRI